ncbi:predicted protein [Sclerotinia sclerotiorum 1980 UF-70]|uniref:Uncharacterized protein n=1 Tax=Sclerotinia sclerotiorum (strain ATCC 18683 / 1980 / Ss-1) TaxID=665079 RepID=A7EFG1_SCLS1|nr:predicted protein [Sclerotinia sclerotiorum 1980 UF-70]EDO01577.1 predicted protein [Sclerotinia sclerotiorum 1980 UF-70]
MLKFCYIIVLGEFLFFSATYVIGREIKGYLP